MRIVRALLAIAVLLAANWIAAALLRPRYETLAPAATVAIAGERLTLEALARRHAPAIWQDPALPGGPLVEMLFEAAPVDGERIQILYRTVWEDEVHPARWIDALYRPFRRLWYGSARDVEYVRVEIDRASGAVGALDYQTEGHARVLVERPPRTALRVHTWNHLLAPLDPVGEGRGALARTQPALRPVTDEDRAALRFARRTYSYLDAFGPRSPLVEVAFFVLAAAIALFAPAPFRARQRSV